MQCRVCRIGVCTVHDAWPPTGPIPVSDGVGYLLNLADRPPVGPSVSETLVTAEVWRSFPGGVVHLCEDCSQATLGPPAQRVAELKSRGELCAHPLCAETSADDCECCGLAWCDSHIGVGLPAAQRLDDLLRKFEGLPEGGTLCEPCLSEYLVRIDETMQMVAAEYPVSNVFKPGDWYSPGIRRRHTLREKARASYSKVRVRNEEQQQSEAMETRLSQLAGPGPCRLWEAHGLRIAIAEDCWYAVWAGNAEEGFAG